MTVVTDDLLVQGDLIVNGSKPTIARSDMELSSNANYPINWTVWRVWDAFQTNLPGTSASDDLGLYGGTFATSSPSIRTYDVKNVGPTTLYARAMIQLPPEYQTGLSVTLRFHAGMLTTVASASATIDAVAYRSNGEAGIGSDLVTTSAININSLTLADRDFTVDPATLAAGDWLDVRIAIAVNDSATATAVIGIIGSASLLCDIKG